jgi:hypothetical protein
LDKRQEDLLKRAKKRIKLMVDAEDHNRRNAVRKLKFKNGDQWEEAIKRRRQNRGRPTLQVNQWPKYSNQVCGEMRQNKVQVSVKPLDNKASIEQAKIRSGIIKDIEYYSSAETIDDHSGQMLVDCGYGASRVKTRPTEENPFIQEIYFESIDNPLCVYMDPEAKDRLYADAKDGMIYTKITEETFKETYPEIDYPGRSLIGKIASTFGAGDEFWYDKGAVSVAEYYYTEETPKKMCLLSDGQVLSKDEADKFIAEAKANYAKAENLSLVEGTSGENTIQQVDDSAIPTVVKETEIKEKKIKWALMTGSEIIDEEDVPFDYIPIVLITGRYTNIEGKKYFSGLFQDTEDPSKMLNYWVSTAAEVIALGPKAQWQGTEKMIEGYKDQYEDANEDNAPFLPYNIDPDAAKFGAIKPERTPTPQINPAILNEIDRCMQFIKDSIGMYNADVGDQGRELSGIAITKRQQPGDISTFIFMDQLAKGIAHRGKIANSGISRVYDTERQVRIRDDSSESFSPINTTAARALTMINESPGSFQKINRDKLQKQYDKDPFSNYNHLSEGHYDVVITTGPAFATQRQEAMEMFVKLAVAAKVTPLNMYLILKNSDFPGAQEAAEIYKRLVPAGIIPPKEGDTPLPPVPPPPQAQILMAKTQVEAAKQKTEQIKLEVEKLKLSKELTTSRAGMRGEALQIVEELSAPAGQHPADMAMLNQGGA